MNGAERREHEMRGGNGARSPQELQDDIQRHRDNLDRTLTALGDKLSPGELLDEGLRYMKRGPGEFFANLAHSARDNPMPVALTAIGLAWMMFDRRRGTQPSAAQPSAEATGPAPLSDEDISDLYADYLLQEYPFEPDEIACVILDDLGDEALESYLSRRSGGGLRERAGQWKEEIGAAGDKAGEWSQRVRAGAAGLSEASRSRIAQARQRMESAADEVRSRTAHARHAAWRRLRQAGRDGARQMQRARHGAAELADRYPLSLMALGVAAGAVLGTALPETRREDRWLGEAGEALRERTGEALHQQGRRVEAAAGAAQEAAAEEARTQGLTGEGLRRQGSELRERAGQVAHAAGDEAERQGLTAEGAREELDEAREKVERVGAAARDAAREELDRER